VRSWPPMRVAAGGGRQAWRTSPIPRATLPPAPALAAARRRREGAGGGAEAVLPCTRQLRMPLGRSTGAGCHAAQAHTAAGERRPAPAGSSPSSSAQSCAVRHTAAAAAAGAPGAAARRNVTFGRVHCRPAPLKWHECENATAKSFVCARLQSLEPKLSICPISPFPLSPWPGCPVILTPRNPSGRHLIELGSQMLGLQRRGEEALCLPPNEVV
jgi:hypothetical protein